MSAFPALANAEAFQSWRANPALWRSTVAEILRGHALPRGAPEAFPTGTNLVVALDERVILKVFPPFYRSQFLSERASLQQLHGRLEIAIPEILVEGEQDGWSYLAITRLEGVLGSVAWPLTLEDEKDAILRQIGEAIAQVQRAPLGPLADIEPRWPVFLAAQIAGCRARHERLGLPPRYLQELEELLLEAPRILPTDFSPVVLTGEYIPENFLLTPTPSGWRLSGLIDFGDVMTGWREYDLLGPSAFMAAGKPERVRALLGGFGYSQADMTPALAQRLMALLLLHRASDPLRHIDIADWPAKAASLQDLQRMLWPF